MLISSVRITQMHMIKYISLLKITQIKKNPFDFYAQFFYNFEKKKIGKRCDWKCRSNQITLKLTTDWLNSLCLTKLHIYVALSLLSYSVATLYYVSSFSYLYYMSIYTAYKCFFDSDVLELVSARRLAPRLAYCH